MTSPNEELRRAFFEDLARAEDETAAAARELLAAGEIPVWVPDAGPVEVLRAALRTPEQVEALANLATDLVHIALHTALVSIDGGAASADVGNLALVDEAGASLGDGLHELYGDHLLATGRRL